MKQKLLLLPVILLAACTSKKMQYPVTEKQDVTDTYFGTTVEDPYRWLEDDNSEETAKWVKAQNEVTDAYLAKIPFRTKIEERLTELWNYPKIGTPYKKAGKYFFYKNDGLQNQSVYYMTDDLTKEPVVLLDPNKLSEDGTVALSGTSVSKDGKYLAYRVARSGSDWNEVFVKNIETGELLKDHVEWVKFSGTAWYKDGFFYSRYDKPAEGDALSGSNEYHKVYYHKLGDEQKNDKLIYEEKDKPKRLFGIGVTEDRRFMILSKMEGSSGNGLAVKDLSKKKAEFIALSKDLKSSFAVIDNIDNELYILTNYKAPRYRLVKVDMKKPAEENWVDIIPESENVLESCAHIGGKLVAILMKDAHNVVNVHQLDGKFEYELKLPGIGTVGSFSGKKAEDLAFYSYTSYNTPTEIYTYDFKTKETKLYNRPKVAFNPDDFVVEQKFYKSKDGTKVPMFLFHKKGIKMDGNNPTLLYGYGGFNVSLTPGFSPRTMVFVENGGVYVVANLRGGGEYGEKWHKSGTKMKKQNVFDDCITAAEFLISEGVTSKEKLGLMGGSNGGLLVGAVLNQRPDLFSAAIPQVGVMDMLRYHKFTIGWAWAGDYGTSEDSKEMFEYLLNYSPYHTIKAGGDYPAIMATTADHDDRVVPAHTFKYMARMQELASGKNPTIVRIESKAGHGAGKPTSKWIEEYTDIWAFIFYNLGMEM
ncbi:S9 family peptidase [Prolixibacteraceae bacterium JC049]|nr:S9 family peptidase [Prolixibacteraceae bacterium JC049]